MTATPHIRAERHGRLGLICLDRPKALNALDLGMIRAMQPLLDGWAQDDGVDAVVLKGEGRAFCAGGDVKAVWEAVRRGDDVAAHAFFSEEYRLDLTINAYPKPVISLLNGLVMGGGGGISILGSHRVVTEKTLYAMPECAIGLYPDAGGTWYLPRLPGALGIYLGLTGGRIGPADFLYSGLGTHFIPSERLSELEDALASGSGWTHQLVSELLDGLRGDPGASDLAARQADIDRLFGHEHLEAVFDALRAESGEWAKSLLEAMSGFSPASMKVTLRQLRLGATLSLAKALELEYCLSARLCHSNDFMEGIRAVLVDKDKSAKWSATRIDEAPDAEITALFQPLGGGADLVLS